MPEFTIEKKERVRDEIKNCEYTKMIMLGHAGLLSFPTQMFQQADSMLKLRRLDLSHNCITVIPSSISVLVNLRELWLQSNPIEEFPLALQHNIKLEVLDIRNTKIREVPFEVAKLTNLYELDWRLTPMATTLKEKYQINTNDVVALKDLLVNLNTRKTYEENLFEKLFGEHFIMDADKPGFKGVVKSLVQDISDAFKELDDLKQFVRRSDKLLPESIDDLKPSTIETSKALFYQMQRDTTRARMGADVEIKIRGMYFDRIERAEVTALLDSIYIYVESLEDIQFLIQYAPQVLPPNPEEANGEVIWNNIVALQTDLTNKRNGSVAAFANALSQIYPEQKPEKLKETALEIAIAFQIERFATKKELTQMSQLTADCGKILPPDFVSLNCQQVITQAREVLFQS